MSVNVRYKDVALGADNNATVITTGKTAFSDVSKIPFGVTPPALATCELNGWGLSHNYKARNSTHNIAFWSSAQSGENCIFLNVPTITLEFTEQYTTTGLSIQFAPNSFDYCRKLKVYWYQRGNIKEQAEYAPTSPVFVLNKAVEAFDKLVFEFYETSLPRKRCKIENIIIGVIRDFNTTELKAVKAIHEIDLISNTAPINVLDVDVHSRDEVDYIFQKKQPVEMTDNGTLIGVYYIDKGERTGRLDISFSCKDAIGLLDLVTYGGGLWLTDTPLTTVLNDVFGGAYEFDIDPAFQNATLRGFIEPNKKQREVLQHIAFALGAVVDTTGTHKIRIFPAPTGTAETISAKETYTGGKVTTSDTVTAVEITAFNIVDERPADNDESIKFNEVEYKYTAEVVTARNPNTVTSDPENVKKYDKCYLVNSSNVQALANNIMAYYQRRNKYAFKHVLSGQEVASRQTAALPWDGMASGHITKMTVTTSNITVSDTEMLLDE
jgi:hypothetical protein